MKPIPFASLATMDRDRGDAYFDRARALVLSRLAQRFESGPIDWSKE